MTEIGLVALALFCLVYDILSPDTLKRGLRLADLSMAGIAGLFILNLCSWGHFGVALRGSFVQDGLSFYFKNIFLLAAFFVLFMSRSYQEKLKRGHEEFSLLAIFSLIGMVFLVSANDFLIFFVALETLTISMVVMTAYLRDKSSSIEAGVKYLLLGALSTAFFLFGLSFVYGATGHTSYPAIQASLANFSSTPLYFKFGMLLIIAALGFKIAAVPFQLWTPDIYEGAPTPVTAYLAIGSKAAGFAALVRLFSTVFFPLQQELVLFFAVLAALTIIYGNLGAIPQTNIKRLLGYSSIGHAGYLLIGLAAFQNSGNEALIYYLLSYLFSTAGIFLVLAALSRYLKSDEISELSGLSQKSPILAAGMMLSLLSLAGVPPLAGFFAKFYLLWSGVKQGLLWLVLIGVLNVITSLYYYLKIVKVMYLEKPLNDTVYSISASEKAMQYLAIVSIFVMGIFQGPFVKLVHTSISKILS